MQFAELFPVILILSTFPVEKARLLSAGLYIAAAVPGVDIEPAKSIYVEVIVRCPFDIFLFPFDAIANLSLPAVSTENASLRGILLQYLYLLYELSYQLLTHHL